MTLLFALVSSHANTTSISDLVLDRLTGSWEALVERGGRPSAGIYLMVFKTPQEAWLVEAWPKSDPEHVRFVGRLVSSALDNGKIDLQFVPAGKSAEPEYVSVQITGRATASGDEANISGKIVIRRRNGNITTEPVSFENALWTRSIADASLIAEKAIKNVRKGN